MALRDAASTRNGELNEELPSILERLGYDTQNGALELDFSKRIAGALGLKGGGAGAFVPRIPLGSVFTTKK